MRKIFALFVSLTFISNVAFAECDFSTGITKNDNGTFTYTKECHIKVGEMRQDLLISSEQIAKLNKSLDLKDLALGKADQRADLWMNTTFKLEDRINTIDKMQSTNSWIYFGLGVVSVFAAGYAASQIYNHR